MKNQRSLPLSRDGWLTRAHPEPLLATIFKDWTRFSTDYFGRCVGEPLQGFYCADTQLISIHRYKLNGKDISHRLSAQTSASAWFMLGMMAESGDKGNPPLGRRPHGCLEIAMSREIDGGMAEVVRLTNQSDDEPRRFELTLELSCPIVDTEWADEMKTKGENKNRSLTPQATKGAKSLTLRFRKFFGVRRRSPSPAVQRLTSVLRNGAKVVRSLTVHARVVRSAGARKVRLMHRRRRDLIISLSAELMPRKSIELRISYEPGLEGLVLKAPKRQRPPQRPLQETMDRPNLSSSRADIDILVQHAISDLESLRLPRIDGRQTGFVSAGIPRYIGIFGRDNLIVGWQSAVLMPKLLGEVIHGMGKLQGRVYDPWRDEQPGRLPHELRLNPMSLTGRKNREAYYGDVTSTPFFCIAMNTHFAWHGDLAFVRRHSDVLKRCCDWILRGLEFGDGFIYYQSVLSAAAGGNRNQAWKDSGDAIVDSQGRICGPPLALIEIQAYAHKALITVAKLFSLLGEKSLPDQLLKAAEALKKKFNKAFWNERKKIYVLALERPGELQIAARASNVGHCLDSSILDPGRISQVVRFLFEKDMFSGWGVRTLSSANPAYDPFSYHRGSVWPVENGEIAARLSHLGFHAEAERLIEAQIALAKLFPQFHLPEVVTGHERSDLYPLPGIYPEANLLQAWSSSALLQMIHSFFGLRPDASRRELIIDPHLPPWLDSVQLERLQFAGGFVDLEFRREAKKTKVSILKRTRGLKIHVI